MSEQPQQIPAKRRRWPRILLVALLVLIALYAAYRYTLHRMVEAKLDEIREQGYPVTALELNRLYPQLASETNAADIYMKVIDAIPDWDESDTTLLPFFNDGTLPAGTASLSNEVLIAAIAFLGKNREALELLHTAAAIPQCRYPFDPTRPRPSYTLGLSKAVRLLALETVLECERNETQAAVRSLKALLAVARTCMDQPMLIIHILNIRGVSLAAIASERLLVKASPSKEDLLELSRMMRGSLRADGFARGLVGLMCADNYNFNHFEDSDMTFGERVEVFVLKATGVADLLHLQILAAHWNAIQAATLPFPVRIKTVYAATDQKPASFLGRRYRLLPMRLGGRAVSEATCVGQLNACLSALAVERSRGANGALPDSLSDLVPKFLDTVPTDPFDGQPLRYKKLAKGYVVYSVGEDGKDDGGDEKRDITFAVER